MCDTERYHWQSESYITMIPVTEKDHTANNNIIHFKIHFEVSSWYQKKSSFICNLENIFTVSKTIFYLHFLLFSKPRVCSGFKSKGKISSHYKAITVLVYIQNINVHEFGLPIYPYYMLN